MVSRREAHPTAPNHNSRRCLSHLIMLATLLPLNAGIKYETGTVASASFNGNGFLDVRHGLKLCHQFSHRPCRFTAWHVYPWAHVLYADHVCIRDLFRLYRYSCTLPALIRLACAFLFSSPRSGSCDTGTDNKRVWSLGVRPSILIAGTVLQEQQ